MAEPEVVGKLEEIRKELVNVQKQIGKIGVGIPPKLTKIEMLLEAIVRNTSSCKLSETYGSLKKK